MAKSRSIRVWNLQGGGYDLITAFHVVEHLSDPIAILKTLAAKLSKNGRMVVEVPSSEDALLTLYDSSAFQHFTYWSQHLFLFNAETLRQLAKQAGLRIASIQQYQRPVQSFALAQSGRTRRPPEVGLPG